MVTAAGKLHPTTLSITRLVNPRKTETQTFVDTTHHEVKLHNNKGSARHPFSNSARPQGFSVNETDGSCANKAPKVFQTRATCPVAEP